MNQLTRTLIQVEYEPRCPRGRHKAMAAMAAMALRDDRHLLTGGGKHIDNEPFHAGLALLGTATWRWTTPSVAVHADC